MNFSWSQEGGLDGENPARESVMVSGSAPSVLGSEGGPAQSDRAYISWKFTSKSLSLGLVEGHVTMDLPSGEWQRQDSHAWSWPGMSAVAQKDQQWVWGCVGQDSMLKVNLERELTVVPSSMTSLKGGKLSWGKKERQGNRICWRVRNKDYLIVFPGHH